MKSNCWDKEGLKSFEDENETVLLKEHALAYADGTSIHGIKYTCEPGRTVLEKFIWITLCVCSIVLCSFLIYPIYAKWRTDPTFTTISSTDYPVWNLDFPAFTLCPNVRVDPLRLENFFMGLEWNATLTVLKMTPKELTSQIQRLLGMYIKYHEFDFSQTNIKMLNENESVIIGRHLQNFSSILKEAMPLCTSSIVDCFWHGDKTNCDDLFTVQSTDNGFCCSFNVIRQEALFGNNDNDGSANDDFFYDYYGSGDINYEDYESYESDNYYYNNYYYYQLYNDIESTTGSGDGQSSASTNAASSGTKSPGSTSNSIPTTSESGPTTAVDPDPTNSENGPTTAVDPNTISSENGPTSTTSENGPTTTTSENGPTTAMDPNPTPPDNVPENTADPNPTTSENGPTTTTSENGPTTTTSENGPTTTTSENAPTTTTSENGPTTTTSENGPTTTVDPNSSRKKRSTDQNVKEAILSSKLRKTNSASSRLGLSLVLDPMLSKYAEKDTIKINNYKGFKALVHGPFEYPEVMNKGFAIGDAEEVFVGISAQLTSSTDGVKAMTMDRRKCVKSDEESDILLANDIILDVYKHYERKSCFLECRARAIYQTCSCLPYHFPNFGKFWNVDTTCNLQGLQCIANVTDRMNAVTPSGEQTFNNANQKFVDGPKCNCPNSCDSTEYREDISKVKIDPNSTFFINLQAREGSTLYWRNKMLNSQAKKFNGTIKLQKIMEKYHQTRASYSLIHIYYKDLGGVKYSREELYGIMDLIGAMGGIIGLCMGFSLLSGAELIYFFTLRFWIDLRRKKDQMRPRK